MLTALLCAVALAQDPPAPSSAAVVQQDVIPALVAREVRARTRSEAAAAWFAGEARLEDAWPAYAPVDVLDRAYLRAMRQRLAAEAEARAGERVADAPDDPTVATALRRARTAALDAEDRFAQLEERFIAGLQAGLARAPGLDADALRPIVADLEATIARAGPDATPEDNALATRALADKGRLQEARRAAVAAFTVPGSPAATAWFTAVEGVEPTAAHLQAVAAMRPLLTGAEGERADRLLEAEQVRVAAEGEARRTAALEAARAALESPPPLTEEDTLEALQAAVEAARQALETAEDPELAQLAVALAERRLAIRAGQVAEDASAAQQRAEEAREAAEATRLAGQQEDRALAALRERVLAVQQTIVEVYEQEAVRREETEARMERIRAALDERIATGANVLALSILDPTRETSIDRAFLDLRESVRTLYEALDELRTLERETRTDARERRALLEGWLANRGSPELTRLDDAFQAARVELDEALANRERTLAANRDEVYRLLDVARDSRRAVRAEASAAARAQARRDFFPELGREVAALPGQVTAGGRALGLSLLGVPALLADLDALQALLVGSFELVLLVGLWGVGRRQMGTLAARIVEAAQVRLGGGLEGERQLAVVQLTALGIALLDLFTALFAFWQLGEGMGGVGLILLVVAARSGLRAAPLLARSTLASPEAMHPSLRLVTAPTEALAARSLWWFAAWMGVSKVGTYTMVALLDADRLRDVVAGLSSAAFWMLVLATIVTWGPVAVGSLARQDEHSPLTAWASRSSGTGPIARVVDLPRYVVALGIVAMQLVVHLVGQLVEGRSGLGWLQSAIARQTIKAEVVVEEAVLPAPVVDALARAEADSMPRPAIDERIAEAHTAWQSTGRRGLIALIGDAGSGKGQLMRRLETIVGGPVTQLEVSRRVSSVEGVHRFLADGLGFEAAGEQQVVDALRALPSQVISVDRAHLLFLRCVRGYAPLQALIAVMTATADHHFWILAVHEPSWDYLKGIAARLKLDAFRDHIRLDPADGLALAGWLEDACRGAGAPVTYDSLATTGLLGGDAGLAEKRARGAYWRLLADAAGGIPENAVGLFAKSLAPTPAGALDVRMFAAPRPDDIQDLGDDLLFSLKALVQHERLTTDELARVLNRRPGAARSTVQHLVHLGLATFDATDSTYTLPASWAPAVERLLRQKHFLYAE
jgi:hypothetical protein